MAAFVEPFDNSVGVAQVEVVTSIQYTLLICGPLRGFIVLDNLAGFWTCFGTLVIFVIRLCTLDRERSALRRADRT